MVDQNLEKIANSFFKYQYIWGKFIPIINTRCHGPGIAISQNAKSFILPFPSKISSHDQWIGQLLSTRGRIYFTDKPCQFYRIHSNQICSAGNKSRRSLLIMIKSRSYMIFNIIKRIIKSYLR